MKEKIKPEGREIVMQTYQSFWDDFEELVRQKVAPLIGKTFTQREWIGTTDTGRVDTDWRTVTVTITHGEVDDECRLNVMGEYTHPYNGKKIKTAFDPRR